MIHDPTPEMMEDWFDALHLVRTDGYGQCAALRDYVSEMIYDGSVGVYFRGDNYYGEQDPGSGDVFINYGMNRDPIELARTLIHEAYHAMHDTDDEMMSEAWAKACVRRR